MSEQSKALVERHSMKEVGFTRTGFGAALIPDSLADVIKFGELMSRGGVAVKKHLRDNPGACIAVTMRALRWEMDPFAVADKTYEVNGVLAYEAQLVNAVLLTRAPIAGRPKYEYLGDPGRTRQCKVTVTTIDGEELDYTSPEVSKITTKNSPLWKQDEDQQLGYFAIRSLARRHFPEVIMGVYTPDEAAEMRDVTPRHRETTGLRERLEQNKAPAGDGRGFSREHVEGVIDGEFEEAAAEPENPAQDSLGAALGGDDLPDGLKAAQEAESGAGEAFDAGDPRRVAAWIEAFKAECETMVTPQAWIAHRASRMDSHIRPIFEKAPARGDELDAWFGEQLKQLRKRSQ